LDNVDELHRRGRVAIRLLDEWDADESGYDEVAWPDLRTALNQERRRIAARLLFPSE
jgi:hypothetical protein